MYAKICFRSIRMLLFIILLTACNEKESMPRNAKLLSEVMLQEGDIVFRRGSGMASRIVLTADTKGVYSHIGIIVKKRNEWKVIHAVPGEPDFKGDPDRVKLESLPQFFETEKAKRGALMRVKGDTARNKRAARRAIHFFETNTLFDHSYNCNDTTEMYCTELIEYVYKQEGIDLSEGRTSRIRIPGLSGDYILPSDIQQSSYLDLIYDF